MIPNMKRGVDYIGVGAGALVVDMKGRLFLSRRGPQAKNERGLVGTSRGQIVSFC